MTSSRALLLLVVLGIAIGGSALLATASARPLCEDVSSPNPTVEDALCAVPEPVPLCDLGHTCPP